MTGTNFTNTYNLHPHPPHQLCHRMLGWGPRLHHPNWRDMLQSEESLWTTSVCDVKGLVACVRRPPHGWDEVECRDKARVRGGRWALCCDVISQRLLLRVVMLRPVEALSSTASCWPRKRPHDREQRVQLGKYHVSCLHLAAVFHQLDYEDDFFRWEMQTFTLK